MLIVNEEGYFVGTPIPFAGLSYQVRQRFSIDLRKLLRENPEGVKIKGTAIYIYLNQPKSEDHPHGLPIIFVTDNPNIPELSYTLYLNKEVA